MAPYSISNYEGIYKNVRLPALIIAGCCVLVALVLSILLIWQHLRSYTNPGEQKWIVAVISMVPIYATESIISLWNPRLSLACDILRNYYEAFALYSFGRYLIACLVQMILKTVCAFLALVLELCGVYGDGEFKWYYGYPYIAVILNFSQMWALFCLVQFYNVTHERLEPIKPLAKFISFKAIVFATWWQGVGIALLCTFGVLPKEGKLQTALQDFLICIEMAIAAIAHVCVFSAKPYHYVPVFERGEFRKETVEATLKIEEGGKEKEALVKETTTQVEAPRTSLKESVQDIVVEGGQRQVVKDVVLTINQAIGPVEKGVTKIQETFHHKTVVSSDEEEEESDIHKEVVEETLTGEEGGEIARM
nr:protein LAZ1 homolog 2 isoform X3 [Arachis hypogaea]